jgi:hypothetical protein
VKRARGIEVDRDNFLKAAAKKSIPVLVCGDDPDPAIVKVLKPDSYIVILKREHSPLLLDGSEKDVPPSFWFTNTSRTGSIGLLKVGLPVSAYFDRSKIRRVDGETVDDKEFEKEAKLGSITVLQTGDKGIPERWLQMLRPETYYLPEKVPVVKELKSK